ncbi:heavy metal-associated isoprenylated plant protein 19-like [Malania oleifera]|uniref:heavy metal-associated isoprenylated plant protein 19-like n=1 Tax=Malania oleifera TaxID=397392 RepID=UPI0025AE2207|nr:heavy metal-associated isoprenylated plant protein 19-like [Malania oleifera]
MGKEKKNNEEKEIVAEFQVSMHCNACERTVAKAISKFKGVETFMTDMRRHRVVVTGRINPEKVLKKLRKKTGKRVVMVVTDEKGDDQRDEEIMMNAGGDLGWMGGGDPNRTGMDSTLVFDDYWRENVLLTMFSDENPTACSIM